MMILAIRDTRKKYFESFCSLFIVEKLENQLSVFVIVDSREYTQSKSAQKLDKRYLLNHG